MNSDVSATLTSLDLRRADYLFCDLIRIQVVIARLVSPRDFGIFAMAGAATTIINILMQFGLAKRHAWRRN